MSIKDLPLNEYGNVSCFDEKTKQVTIPEGLVKTKLTVSQLKMLGIKSIKAHIGWEIRRFGGRHKTKMSAPVLVNLIEIEDEPKAIEYSQRFHIKKTYGMKDTDWLFK